jgi:formylglycine-generating enzyme required for sulfatase activity
VRGISIWEARAFARWLSKTKGGRWRLPTDLEWQVAAGWDPINARLNPYPWGETWNAQALTLKADAPGKVGSAETDKSPLGVHDAGGSVREWVERPGQEPVTHGAYAAANESLARFAAQVLQPGRLRASAPAQFTVWVGFRLVREIDVVE